MTLWINPSDTWYAELESGGFVYGLARRVVGSEGVRYEVLDRDTGEWIFASEGAGYFTGAGGVTDATPITPEQAAELERALRQ